MFEAKVREDCSTYFLQLVVSHIPPTAYVSHRPPRSLVAVVGLVKLALLTE